ncbi:MAG: sensor histidine kinase [Clostridia bacterium]|nr:sensor histidine kinase [Clostridia bacterium]
MNLHFDSVFFVFELFLTEYVFVRSFNRRSRYLLRFFCSFAACVLVAAVFPADGYPLHTFGEAALNFIRFFLLFAMTIATVWFCYDAKWGTVLSACTAGYALQHLGQRAFVLAGLVISPFDDFSYPLNYFLRELLCLVIVAPLFVVFILTIGKNVSERYYKDDDKNDPKLIAVSFATIFICMIVTRLLDFEDVSVAVTLITSIYAITCCALVLLLKSSFLLAGRQKRELELTRQLYAKEQEEYRYWQSSLDVINIKCHDLKHQISALRQNFSEQSIKEIEESVMIYDSALKTGNEIIDVILFEKNVYCEKNGIQFVFMVDGAGLGFIERTDLFTFFTNMLNNAIEAVMKLPTEKRAINLTVKGVANMVFISEENMFDGKINMADGLPITSKEDKINHGFGLKSIKRFVEKYGGTINISAKNELFSLKISLPRKTAASA